MIPYIEFTKFEQPPPPGSMSFILSPCQCFYTTN